MQAVADENHPHILRRNAVAGLYGRLNGHPVVPQHHGQFHRKKYGGGQCVGVGGHKIHLVIETQGGGVRLSDSQPVSVGYIRQIQHTCPLLFDASAAVGSGPGACDIGIHAAAGKIFPDLPDNQHIGFRYQNTGHQAFGVFQKRRFFRGNFFIVKHHDPVGLIVGIFNGSHAEQNVGMGSHIVAEQRDAGGKGAETVPVQAVRAFLLSQADAQHFHQSRLIGAAERAVGFDPVDRHDAVRLPGHPVNVDRKLYAVLIHLSQKNRLHGRTDGTAAEFFCDAVAGQYLPLAPGGGSSVASHGGNDKGACACFFQKENHLPENDIHVCDTPAASGNCNGHARTDLCPDARLDQLLPGFRRHILYMAAGECLGCPKHLGKLHIRQQRFNSAVIRKFLCHFHPP